MSVQTFGNCKDCKFWKAQRFTEKHFCRKLLKSKDSEAYPATLGAYADGYDTAWLITGPKFGCNQFKAKD